MDQKMLKGTRKALEQVAEKVGGTTELARQLKITPQSVGGWIMRGYVPAVWVLALEKMSDGAVTRHELRPDVFGEET